MIVTVRRLLVSHRRDGRGKTGVGLALAERLGAEIISLDSMAIYRGMDIGTAKPTAARAGRACRTICIDIVDPADEYSVAQYVEAARGDGRRDRARGREVLFVGGTPLYLKSLLRGLFDGPPADWESARGDRSGTRRRSGKQALHERLDANRSGGGLAHPSARHAAA